MYPSKDSSYKYPMGHDEKQKSFYDRVARNFGKAESSSMRDPFIRHCENDFIFSQVHDWIEKWEYYPKILDLGCGNGATLDRLEQTFSGKAKYYGIDANESLISIASNRENSVHYQQKDMRSFRVKEKFQIVLTQRSLINLASSQEQYDMIKNIDELLGPGGRLVLIESFEEGLVNLNKARKQMNLVPINVSKQNVYLKERFALKLKESSFFEIKSRISQHQSDLGQHFFATRLMHPILREVSGSRVETLFVKALREMKAYQNPNILLSPIQLRVFEKRF